jgi:exodeoxyribonuclease VII small subunit
VSEPAAGLDELLDRLEVVIGRLADPGAPLERLVADHEEAGRLLDAAQAQLDAASSRLASPQPSSEGSRPAPEPPALS